MEILENYLQYIQERSGKKNWIQKATRNKGGLHRALGVPEDKKIPAKKLTVKVDDSEKLKKKKILAKTLKKLSKKG